MSRLLSTPSRCERCRRFEPETSISQPCQIRMRTRACERRRSVGETRSERTATHHGKGSIAHAGVEDFFTLQHAAQLMRSNDIGDALVEDDEGRRPASSPIATSPNWRHGRGLGPGGFDDRRGLHATRDVGGADRLRRRRRAPDEDDRRPVVAGSRAIRRSGSCRSATSRSRRARVRCSLTSAPPPPTAEQRSRPMDHDMSSDMETLDGSIEVRGCETAAFVGRFSPMTRRAYRVRSVKCTGHGRGGCRASERSWRRVHRGAARRSRRPGDRGGRAQPRRDRRRRSVRARGLRGRRDPRLRGLIQRRRGAHRGAMHRVVVGR